MKALGLLKYSYDKLKTFFSLHIKSYKELQDRYPEYKIGRGCYGPLEIKSFRDSSVNLQIGSFCSFGQGVKIFLSGEHRTNWITTYPFDRKYFNLKNENSSTYSKGNVSIGNDVWIGEDVLIMSGTEIGDGVVIGARSVVRGKLVPYGIYVGSPARLIKMRFDPSVIDTLLQIQWWNWPDNIIRQNASILMSQDIGLLIDKFSNIDKTF